MYADHRSKKSVETMNNKDTCISHVGVAVADKLLGPESTLALAACWAPYLCAARPVLCTEGHLAASLASIY